MTPPLQGEVRRHFPYLFEKWGFAFEDIKADFGGNIAVAQSGILRIRFIRDRTDFFLDIGSTTKPEIWIGFYRLIDGLRANGMVSIEYKYVNRMKTVGKLLDQCFPVIQAYFQEAVAEDEP